MKFLIPKIFVVGAVAMIVASASAAPFLTGEIGFTGGVTLNGVLSSASAYTALFGPGGPASGDPVVSGGSTGSYFPVAGGTSAAFTPFTFNPAPVGSFQLWSFTIGSTVYSFDATTVEVVTQTPRFLNIKGTGMAHVSGFEPTPGTWSITDTGAGSIYTFGCVTTITPVPEPSVLAFAMGAGLIALGVCRRAKVKAS